MKLKHIAYLAATAALFAGCADDIDNGGENPGIPGSSAPLCFSISRQWPDQESRAVENSNSPAVDFSKGDKIGVFACYREQANSSTFSPNFMKKQTVEFDGLGWNYSPLKYWPMDGSLEFCAYIMGKKMDYLDIKGDNPVSGMPLFYYHTKAIFDPFYVARSKMNMAKGEIFNPDGSKTPDGRVKLVFRPTLDEVYFTASADRINSDPKDPNLYDKDDDGYENDKFRDSRFLILSFKIWGFYQDANYDMIAGWTPDKEINKQWTKKNPLDLTPWLLMSDIKESLGGYLYKDKNDGSIEFWHGGYREDENVGYCIKNALIVHEGEKPVRLFKDYGFFIPSFDDANEPGFEIQYVVLTKNNQDDTKPEFRETGIITRSGSMKVAPFDRNGLQEKLFNLNLRFGIEEVTVTVNLYDYKYQPMF